MGGGGLGSNNLNDVWATSDGGTTWNELTNAAPWSIRLFFGTATTSTGAVLVMGGVVNFAANDVWVTSDGGTTWEQLNNAPWSVRFSFGTATTATGAVLVMGGRTGSSPTFMDFNDVWVTNDGGTTWDELTSAAPWGVRSRFGTATTSTAVLVMGGMYPANLYNDVWGTCSPLAAPVFLPPSGFNFYLPNPAKFTMFNFTCSPTRIFYTTDGTLPTQQSPSGYAPLVVELPDALHDTIKTVTVKAVAMDGDHKSNMSTVQYNVHGACTTTGRNHQRSSHPCVPMILTCGLAGAAFQ